jgi:hypothetical protein
MTGSQIEFKSCEVPYVAFDGDDGADGQGVWDREFFILLKNNSNPA